MKLLFIQGKGGVGKSTLAFLFAIALDRVGKSISIQDLDPQESLTAWLKDTENFKFSQNGEITIIDTPPRIDDPLVLDAIRRADRIVIPTTPSPAELATTRHSAGVIAQHMRPDARALVVFNRVKKMTTYGKNLITMAENLPIPAAQNFLSEREVYKHALLDGWTALDAAAKDEVTSLALEIQ
jgi:chromosome partitioning protein